MPKEKSINPAQAQRKAEKAKAIKKGKAEVQARRNERLARRNPDRLQKQLDDLKAIEAGGGKLTSHEKTVLEGLEKELRAVRRARETLGDAAPTFGAASRGGAGGARGGRGGGGVLGKRRRDDDESESEGDVPDDVKRIPMPRDTPPPIAKDVLDRWYQARRERLGLGREREREGAGRGTDANSTPLGEKERRVGGGSAATPMPPVEVKTVYEAKPVLRDLRKEAVAFVPAAVRVKMQKGKGIGGLVEPEEADKLEREGYLPTSRVVHRGDEGGVKEKEHTPPQGSRTVAMEQVEDDDG